ncbi:chemotaxis protein CheW [Dethiobacter alkaliphilus]|uniref:chemotaxis protein CheW n=1 Tax=Dethiobacter alkaliphilus TaxID=427926 RepID=UPI002226CBAB|nr:chemotaxis protein CheW [Dethiobacter alkaliphilus]MCW3488716.1 chemotaxis protein CheW [Dethiobacter alkaliphilus]
MNSLVKKNEEQSQEELQLVAFFLQGEEFAVDIQKVREVLKLTQITPLPQSLDFIEGVINLRGEVIPVIDLRKRFRIAGEAQEEQTRIIIVEIDESLVGLIVDSVTEVLHLAVSAVDAPPRRLAGTRTEFISGVGKLNDRLIIILDLEKILSTDEQVELEQLQPGPVSEALLGQ